jgi:hypothetical protein
MTPFERKVLTIVSRIPGWTRDDLRRHREAGRETRRRPRSWQHHAQGRPPGPALPSRHRRGRCARRLLESAFEKVAPVGRGGDRHTPPGGRIRQIAWPASGSAMSRRSGPNCPANAEKANKYEPFRALGRL